MPEARDSGHDGKLHQREVEEIDVVAHVVVTADQMPPVSDHREPDHKCAEHGRTEKDPGFGPQPHGRESADEQYHDCPLPVHQRVEAIVEQDSDVEE